MTMPQPPAHAPLPPQPQPHGARTASEAAPHDTPTAVFAAQSAPPAPPQSGPSGAAGPGRAPTSNEPPAPPMGQLYTSPIPVVRAHLGHALLSEWTKIRSLRSTLWTLGVMALLTVGISTLAGWGLSSQEEAELPVLSAGFFGLMLGQLCVITLGVLVITSEYSTGMIRTTLTACPRRARVLTAKALVFFAVSFTMTLAAAALSAVIQSALLSGRPVAGSSNTELFPEGAVVDGELIATSSEWMGATVGAALYVALLGLLSLAVGTLLRSSPGAITTMIGLVLLPFLVSLFLWAESVQEVGEKMREYSVLNGLSTLYRLPMSPQADGSETGWPLLGLLAALTGVALVGAYARISTRDV